VLVVVDAVEGSCDNDRGMIVEDSGALSYDMLDVMMEDTGTFGCCVCFLPLKPLRYTCALL